MTRFGYRATGLSANANEIAENEVTTHPLAFPAATV